uniref:Keratin associated protein 19-5 n=1 Tax=Oryctolagus cuniculus TaxID=9986 RepID=A0A5F9CAQ5_RABIT
MNYHGSNCRQLGCRYGDFSSLVYGYGLGCSSFHKLGYGSGGSGSGYGGYRQSCCQPSHYRGYGLS